jgi:hypothetical protein
LDTRGLFTFIKKIHILYYNIALDYRAGYRVEPGGVVMGLRLILECINIGHTWFIYIYKKKIHILYYNIALDYRAGYRVEPGGVVMGLRLILEL